MKFIKHYMTGLGLIISLSLFSQGSEQALEQARSLMNEAENHRKQNQFVLAKEAFEKALNIYDSLNVRSRDQANTLVFLARTEHNLGLADQAFIHLERAIALKGEIFGTLDHPQLIPEYTLLGDILSSQNREFEAISYLERAQRISSTLPLNQQQFIEEVLSRLSDSYLRTNNFQKSLEMKEQLLELRKKRYGPASYAVGEAYYRLGTQFTFIGDFKTAVEYQLKADEILTALGAATPPRALHTVRVYLGINLLNAGENERGDEYVRNGVVALEEGSLKENIYQKKILYFNVANAYFRVGRTSLALDHYQKIIEVSAGKGAPMDDHLNPPVGQIFDFRELLPAFASKSMALAKLFKEEGDEQRLHAAYQTVLSADSLTDILKTQPNVFRDKVFFQSLAYSANTMGVALCEELYEVTDDKLYLEQAFRFSEKNKSNLLLSSLQDALFLRKTDIPDSVVLKSEAYADSITYTEATIHQLSAGSTEDSSELGTQQNKLIALRAAQTDYLDQIRAAYPQYYQARYGQNYVDIASLQSMLDPDEMLISHHLGQENLYTFHISKDSLGWQVTPADQALRESINEYSKYLTKPLANKAEQADFIRRSRELRSLLLPPKAVLGQFKSLVLVPDNLLATIPFETLIDGDSTEADSEAPGYLIKTHNISYANSSTILSNQRKSRLRSGGQKVLAFAPVFEESQFAGLAGIDSVRSGLGALSWTREEVQNIEQFFDADVFLGETATERKFKQSGQDYSIIHVASHGLLNKQNPMFSRLVFSPHETDSVDDGFLNTIELFNMKLPADMVVLSACNSGAGEVMNGEGVLSLASGFFYAGAKSLIMTFWTANDQSSTTIMTDFYRHLSEGMTKSEALRQAKLSYLENNDGLLAHPYYWAHFIVNGDDRPLTKEELPWYWLLLILPLLYLLGRKRLRSRHA